jgi:predicted ATPase
VLSGRAEERARLLDAVHAGLGGDSRAVLVHGEAGIGKTTLVRSVCAEVAAAGVQVLWGQCLRFGTADAMYHPFVLALETWLRGADPEQRARLVENAPSGGLILPSLGAQPSTIHTGLMAVVASLVDHVVAEGPTVLVVDDVQWADAASRDVLTYVVAGFGGQPLAVVTTHRDEAVVSDDFQRWWGNLRRLPGTSELTLGRLDEEATVQQLSALLRAAPDAVLAEQVFERSRGNPYLSELLVRRVDAASTTLPDHLPDDLSRALLDAWWDLSAAAREVARSLAIAGRPTGLPTLDAVAVELGIGALGSVREAVDAGVLVLDGERAWFRHPLLAVVLADTYLPSEAAPVHAA